MNDLGCAVILQGIVVMREWKVKDAQWKVCGWTISMCLALRDRLLQKLLGYLSKVAPKIFKSFPKVAHFTKKLLKSCFLSTQKISFYY